MSKKFSFKKSQNFRICVDKISFYATKKQILSGVGYFYDFNLAIQMVLVELEKSINRTLGDCVGILITRNGFSVQLNSCTE